MERLNIIELIPKVRILCRFSYLRSHVIRKSITLISKAMSLSAYFSKTPKKGQTPPLALRATFKLKQPNQLNVPSLHG